MYTSARELLDHRVQNGWKPTPSDVEGPDKILGFARCLAESEAQSSTGVSRNDAATDLDSTYE